MAIGVLYIVATPLGNLEDITFKAIKVLKSVSAIACEDSRRTVKLLNRYEIKTPLLTYQEYNKEAAGGKIIQRLKKGEKIALVSDAGTPGISDPGYNLVRDAILEGITVEVVPGPSAIVSAIVLSGLPTDRFCFEGFIPPKKDRRIKKFESLKDEERTIIFYESPHRVKESLVDMADVMGGRRAALLREMTKLNEEVVRGTVIEIRDEMAEREKVHGEITLVIEGAKHKEIIQNNIEMLIEGEIHAFDGSPSELARKLSQETGIPRKVIYAKILNMKK
jgi:16S rRNA (cytidine1402-2'-O)-methyltransferase